MSLISRMRKQKAVYWPRTGFDAYGKITYGTAVEITCRWEDGEFEVQDAKGVLFNSATRVFVDRDMELGGKLVLGTLAAKGGATPHAQSREIKKIEKIPNLKATEQLITVYLGG